ncbi:MAG: tRNA(Ile)(2)-agmatinylcytidine synthase [Methanosarcinales archaeon]|nr:tRNA(Ile)(2)-agmatinylcytidine synthase [Methanosarcinales archaeon]
MIIGMDDTDSNEGMCTTYLTAVLINEIKELGNIKGMPHLIRLNPNIKYKTRGNAALALEIEPGPGNDKSIIDTATSLMNEMADLECENTNPGIIFLSSNDINIPGLKNEIEQFMYRAIRDVLTINDVDSLIKKYHLTHSRFKNGRGLIGALAACAAVVCGLPDHTYELIAYRLLDNFGLPRVIDRGSVFRADEKTYPGTWDTVDRTNNTVVCAPHSPDPILFGIRGDDINAIKQAFSIINSEPVGLTLLYISNQGTDLHLVDASVHDIYDERSYKVNGTVLDIPKTISGGHVFFTLNQTGCIECAAFEPTKGLRHIIRELIPGDVIRVCGGVNNGTLNIEKLEVVKLATHQKTINPICPSCGKRMKSAGKGQGFRCKDCGTNSDTVIKLPVKRNIKAGIYEVPPCARRHISKPLVRSSDPRAFPSR